MRRREEREINDAICDQLTLGPSLAPDVREEEDNSNVVKQVVQLHERVEI